MESRRYFKRIVGALSVIIVILLMITLRVYHGSWSEYTRGIESIKKGDYTAAVKHFEKSVRWYLPMNGYNRDSVKQLFNIAEEAQKREDSGLSIKAYNALISALSTISIVYNPYPDELKKAREGNEYRDYLPNRLWSAVSVLSFFAYISGIIAIIFYGFRTDGSIKKKSFAILLGITVMLFIIWILGLTKA
ncbi:MAG: hypothetical protein AB1488_03535 [Nitrospirota bacterium]